MDTKPPKNTSTPANSSSINPEDNPEAIDQIMAHEVASLAGDKDKLIPAIARELAGLGAEFVFDPHTTNLAALVNGAVKLLSTVAMVNADKHPMAMTREQLLVDNALAAREGYLLELAMGNIANFLLDPRVQSLPAGKLRGAILQMIAEGLECRAAHSQNAQAAMAKIGETDPTATPASKAKLTLVKGV